MGEETTTKFCAHCKQTKPLTDFYKNKGRLDGVCVYCKICTNERIKEKRKENPERFREISKKSKIKNKEHNQAYNKKYREVI